MTTCSPETLNLYLTEMSKFEFNPSTTRFDLANALTLAQAAALAYESKSTIEKVTTKDWGMSRCEYFDKQDTQAFLGAALI